MAMQPGSLAGTDGAVCSATALYELDFMTQTAGFPCRPQI